MPKLDSTAPPLSPRRPSSRATASRRASPTPPCTSLIHSSASPTPSSTSPSPFPSTNPFIRMISWAVRPMPQCSPNRDSSLLGIGITFMKGLRRFRGELRTNREDVHMNIEVALEVYVGVCKNWREIMKEIVKSLEVSGKLTFPISLKQVHQSVQETSIDDGMICKSPI